VAPLAELRDLLTTAGIRHAEDPGRLTPPGVLIRLEAFTQSTLAGLEIATTLFVVVPDATHEQATAELVALTNRLLEVVDPDGPISPATVQLPGEAGGARLPALMFPLHLYP
jgi:hypothetical protein